MSTQTITAARVAVRRREVAGLLLARHTQQEIAAALKVTQSTISTDIQAIRAGWTAEARADLGELIAQECRALDADEIVWRERLAAALKDDLPLAVRIYDRCIGPIGERRARLRGMLPPPKDMGADRAELDQILAELGFGPDAASPAPAAPAL